MKSREIGIEEIHDLELGILKEIDRICAGNSIRYYLQAGSVLGAIRHGGFIPWDEDADIIIPINQYKAFEEACKRELDKKYKLFTCKDKDNSVYFMRMSLAGQNQLCAYVDIFILAGVPSEKEEQAKFMKTSKRYNQLRLLRFVSPKKGDSVIKNLGRIIVKPLARCIPLSILNRQFFKHCETVPYEKAEYVMNPCGKYGAKNLFKKEVYGTPQIVKFESIEMPIPADYEPYLRQYYKDYMKYPAQNIIEEGLNHKVVLYEE